MNVPFKVVKFAKVKAQINALLTRAAAIGMLPSCFDALERIQNHLESKPLEWGDPDYNLKRVGGVACHGIEEPFLVRFAVYETEQVVCIYTIEALATSPLGNP